MKSKFAENIKAFRKERRMTQEQLAEIMGVTVGAVYKWESKQSAPDLSTIMALADLFETSTDVLVGYEWQGTNAQSALARIKKLSAEKCYEEAGPEAEKLLKKFPNNFDIVYQSGLMYLAKGEDTGEKSAGRRAVELLEHACELIAQNTDDSVTEVSIRTQISKAQLQLGNIKTALKLLKQYNACGVNDAFIGMLLADYIHDIDEAGKYLGKAVESAIANLDYAMTGYINVFFQKGNYNASLECVQWLRNMLRGNQSENELTCFDKYDCILLETIAEIYCFKDDTESARKYLRAAIEKARKYDMADPEEIRNIKIYEDMGITYHPAYDFCGKTAMECLKAKVNIEERKETEDEEFPYLLKLWEEEVCFH